MAGATATEMMKDVLRLQATYGTPPSDIKTEEEYFMWIIVQIHRKAQAEAQPFIARLAEIENTKPPLPIVLPIALVSDQLDNK